MKEIYLDNGASSFPKAPGLAEKMSAYITVLGASVNRGAYPASYQVENTVFETRERLCQLFSFDQPENVVFTKNVTESLNILIKGLLKEGDHVIVSAMEHNAVMRPLQGLAPKVSFSRLACSQEGDLLLEEMEGLIQENTRAVIMTQASNVCGTILDLEAVGKTCKERDLFFIIDSAQTAGFLPSRFNDLQADALAFTGHKSLLGPQGIGGFLITDRLADQVLPLIEGGTGSLSEEEVQPHYMPDKYEAGTPNIPGIYGLHQALGYLLEEGVSSIQKKEMALLAHFLEGLAPLEKKGKIRRLGKPGLADRTPVVSLDFPTKDNGQVAHQLAQDYKIMTRSGLHCAPSAHKTLGTFPRGTVRFSLGRANTPQEIDQTLAAIQAICREKE